MHASRTTRVLGLAATSVLALLALSGCYSRLTGGGWMESAGGGGRATFAINYDATDVGFSEPPTTRFKGTYHDPGSGVRLRFDDLVKDIFEDPTEDCAEFTGRYVSQDPKQRGAGDVRVKACDEGEPGAGRGDSLRVEVLSGPYAGYENDGPILGGNFQGHEGFSFDDL